MRMNQSITLPLSIDVLRMVHSITSSVLASRVCGTVMPSALAVLRLITNSNLLDNVLQNRTLIGAFCALCQFIATGSTLALADSKIEIKYDVTYLGVTVGSASWQLVLSGNQYEINASARIKGMTSVLINGEGSGRARGVFSKGHPFPDHIEANVVSPEEIDTIKMVLQTGTVRELVALPPFPPLPARVPVTAGLLQGVLDPLSAVLIGDGPIENAPDACKRQLPIFDGRRRYDVEMSFKRTEEASIPDGIHGRVMVCTLELTPIAGHQVKSSALDYLIKSKDIEIWFAPLPEAHMFVPVSAHVPMLIGTLHINLEHIGVDTFNSPQVPTLAGRGR
jgi:hypothetical protein